MIQNPDKNPDLSDFLILQKNLLSLERDAELAETQELIIENDSKSLQDMGLALINLKLKSLKVGFFGKTLLTLVSINFFDKVFKSPQNATETQKNLMKLPRNRLGTGDLVSLYESCVFFTEKSPLINALVFKISEYKLILAVEKSQQAENLDFETLLTNKKKLSVLISSNEVTYKRHLKVMDRISQIYSDISHPSNRLVRLFLSNSETSSFSDNNKDLPIEFYEKSLNSEQKTAVEKAINARDFFLIHGPPGTGKTKTLVEIIYQLVKRNLRVLACGPSNVSVDNIAERLPSEIKACRVGNPVRLKPEILHKSLDFLVKKCPIAKDIKEIKRTISELLRKQAKSQGSQRFDILKKIGLLRKELKELDKTAIREIFAEAQVILSTNTTAADKLLEIKNNFRVFDVVIIDEAAQALEISCWIPILSGKKVILAGDHKQLPPTIKSKEASVKGYSRTLFERLSENPGLKEFSLTLKRQYRMNEKIMNWSSQFVYQGMLEADETARTRTIKEMSVLLFIDTDGSNMGESNKSINESSSSRPNVSKSNRGEADLVLIVLKELITQGVAVTDIGIITPYNSQVSLIKSLIEKETTIVDSDKLEVSTVDGFQGREKEAIIISMVRSNPKREIGFLREFRRMNVAVTRAKRFVGLIGDKETVKGDEFLKNMVEYFENCGEYRLALQYKGMYNELHFNDGWFNEKMEKKEAGAGGQNKKKKKKKDKNDKNVENYKKTENENNGNHENNIKNDEKNVKNHNNDQNEEFKEEFHREHNLGNKDETELLEKLKTNIEEFIIDQARDTMELPGLNSYFRLKAHEFAENQGLLHESKGEGSNRRLILTKKQEKSLENNEKIEKNEEKKTENTTKVIPKPNNIKPKPLKKPKDKPQDNLTEDEFLDQMIMMNKTCNFISNVTNLSCPNKVHLISHCCEFCNRVFCLKHSLAETHGCGDRASFAAQIKFREEYDKKNKGNLKAKPEEKEYLKMKVQQKLKASQQNRNTKAPKKEKK